MQAQRVRPPCRAADPLHGHGPPRDHCRGRALVQHGHPSQAHHPRRVVRVVSTTFRLADPTPGGFPCPNLTAPTPFSLTPATTPAPSPGPHKTTFGALPGMPFSGLPALSTIKPKVADDHRFKDREERRRLADYSLKPRLDYAFGSWGVEELRWRFDGGSITRPSCLHVR